MKYLILTCRILLGVAFAFFGANHILNFLHMSPPPSDATTWLTLMATHHYFAVVGVLELVAGILLLVGRFVPLALTILAPVLVNILLFDVLFEAGGLAPGLSCALFWLVLAVTYRHNFMPLFAADPKPDTTTP